MFLAFQNGWRFVARQIQKAITNPKTVRTITSASTLAKSDSGGVIVVNSASGVEVTIPNDATVEWADQERVTLYQAGAGTASFTAGSDVTLRSPANALAGVQYGFVTAVRVGANEWTLLR